MADTKPSKLNIFYKVYLCFIAIFCPKKLVEEERKDNEMHNNFSNENNDEHPAHIVHHAFRNSFRAILICVFIGITIGILFNWKFIKPSPIIFSILQIIGASLLLWGTLFVQDVTTYCGVTLSERVNKWIYHSLYCLGTVIIIFSIVLSFDR